VTGIRITQFLLFLFPACVAAQIKAPTDAYLFRMEHGSFGAHACVLVQRSGTFHLESTRGEDTRVLEGSVDPATLSELDREINDSALASLSQDQIDEPVISHHEFLQLNIARGSEWQDLVFRSAESQEPYRKSLMPLIQWMNNLHKFPHKELSEDAGKNNCLAPGKIALKKRNFSETGATSARASGLRMTPSNPAPGLPPPVTLTSAPLLRMLSMRMKSGVASERCVLIDNNGDYRTELRAQKSGSKNVNTKIDGGRLAPAEVSELRELLSDPALRKTRHHETSRAVLPMLGEMLELEIHRGTEVQELVLSSNFNRSDVPFFYSGDGDIAAAQPVLNFLAEHVENAQVGSLDPNLRNGCSSAP
jgi:hypothetical protein